MKELTNTLIDRKSQLSLVHMYNSCIMKL